MKSRVYFLLCLFVLILGSCGQGRVDKDLKPFDSTNESLDIDTIKNKHIIYDNP